MTGTGPFGFRRPLGIGPLVKPDVEDDAERLRDLLEEKEGVQRAMATAYSNQETAVVDFRLQLIEEPLVERPKRMGGSGNSSAEVKDGAVTTSLIRLPPLPADQLFRGDAEKIATEAYEAALEGGEAMVRAEPATYSDRTEQYVPHLTVNQFGNESSIEAYADFVGELVQEYSTRAYNRLR